MITALQPLSLSYFTKQNAKIQEMRNLHEVYYSQSDMKASEVHDPFLKVTNRNWNTGIILGQIFSLFEGIELEENFFNIRIGGEIASFPVFVQFQDFEVCMVENALGGNDIAVLL